MLHGHDITIVILTGAMEFDCYAQRLLNPFRGIINTIRYRPAEAVTADGERRDIYVSGEFLQDNLRAGKRVPCGDIRYGSWSAGTAIVTYRSQFYTILGADHHGLYPSKERSEQ